MPTKKIERNYLQDMTLADARLWFRYRCQIMDNIKGNRSSQWENRMHCRHCITGENETQEHLEKCTFFRKYRESLDLTIREHKLIFWRRVTRILKDRKNDTKDTTDKDTGVIIPEHENNDTNWSGTYLQGLYRSLTGKPAPEAVRVLGPRANRARDMSVSEVISDHPL